MREIKFRAWDKEEKRMYFNVQNAYDYIHEHDANNGDAIPATYFGEMVEEDSKWDVMQYTGLHDVHGKEIYEGDVVRWGDSDGMRQSIEWNPHRGSWSGCDKSGACSETLWLPETCEIIGNIYENPELLKV